MNSLQRTNRFGWVTFGFLAGVCFSGFTFIAAPRSWYALTPDPDRRPSRLREGRGLLERAVGQTRGKRELRNTFWDYEWVGSHYAVIATPGHDGDLRGELYAITDHPGYPTLRTEFHWSGGPASLAELGPYGHREER